MANASRSSAPGLKQKDRSSPTCTRAEGSDTMKPEGVLNFHCPIVFMGVNQLSFAGRR